MSGVKISGVIPAQTVHNMCIVLGGYLRHLHIFLNRLHVYRNNVRAKRSKRCWETKYKCIFRKLCPTLTKASANTHCLVLLLCYFNKQKGQGYYCFEIKQARNIELRWYQINKLNATFWGTFFGDKVLFWRFFQKFFGSCDSVSSFSYKIEFCNEVKRWHEVFKLWWKQIRRDICNWT